MLENAFDAMLGLLDLTLMEYTKRMHTHIQWEEGDAGVKERRMFLPIPEELGHAAAQGGVSTAPLQNVEEIADDDLLDALAVSLSQTCTLTRTLPNMYPMALCYKRSRPPWARLLRSCHPWQRHQRPLPCWWPRQRLRRHRQHRRWWASPKQRRCFSMSKRGHPY